MIKEGVYLYIAIDTQCISTLPLQFKSEVLLERTSLEYSQQSNQILKKNTTCLHPHIHNEVRI